MGSVHKRVGLDGSFLTQPNTGSGQYTLHLWRRLQVTDAEPEVVLLRPGTDRYGEATSDRVVVGREPGWLRSAKARKLWWEQSGVLATSRAASVDLLHIPYFSAPRFTRRPVVTTIHDVIPLLFPEYGGSVSMRAYLRLATSAARRAALILTDSECSLRDIERLLGIPGDRIRVIPLAADERFRPAAPTEREDALRQRFGLRGPVVFNVGGLDARKNLATLVEGFARALPELPDATRLVIAGRAHTDNPRLYPPLEPVIRQWGVEGKVLLTGPIDEDDKLAFYRLADLYVFPSLYEGFGLSPLEAMACGTPVIVADRSSLPEVVETGGLLVDPTPQKLGAAMIAVLTDEYDRRNLASRALEQAARFSWEDTARLTLAAYQEVLSGSVGRTDRERRR
jgi:glycosyltransferase involved in cell wall biosynthesis